MTSTPSQAPELTTAGGRRLFRVSSTLRGLGGVRLHGSGNTAAPSARFDIYGASWCPFTRKALDLTSGNNVFYSIDSPSDVRIPPYIRHAMAVHQHATMPIIIETRKGLSDVVFIGGFDSLKKLFESERATERLTSPWQWQLGAQRR
jgi:hypothetical protein